MTEKRYYVGQDEFLTDDTLVVFRDELDQEQRMPFGEFLAGNFKWKDVHGRIHTADMVYPNKSIWNFEGTENNKLAAHSSINVVSSSYIVDEQESDQYGISLCFYLDNDLDKSRMADTQLRYYTADNVVDAILKAQEFLSKNEEARSSLIKVFDGIENRIAYWLVYRIYLEKPWSSQRNEVAILDYKTLTATYFDNEYDNL